MGTGVYSGAASGALQGSSFGPWGALAGGLLGGVGGYLGDDANKQANRAVADQFTADNTAYSPVGVYGPGGTSVTYGGAPSPYAQYQSYQGGSYAPQQTQQAGSYAPNQYYAGGGGSYQEGGPSGPVMQQQPTFTGGKDPYMDIYDLGGGLQQVGRSIRRTNLGTANIDLGAQQGAFNQLAGLGGEVSQGFGIQNRDVFNQLGQNLSLQGAQGLQGYGAEQLNAQLQMQGNATGQLYNGFNQQAQNPYLQALGQSLYGQSANAFGALPGTQQQSYDQTLASLRAQAQPQNERQFAALNDNLFSTGRMGTTGGGLQTEAFARGLGQADLSMQLAAAGEGRNAQNAQMNLGVGLQGAGGNAYNLQDSLLSNAYNRFGSAQNLSNTLQQQLLGNAGQAVTLGQAVQGSPYAAAQYPVDLLNKITTGTGQLANQGYQAADFSRALMGDQYNARAGLGVNPGAGQASADAAGGYSSLLSMLNKENVGAAKDAWGSLTSKLGGNNNTAPDYSGQWGM